MRACIGILAILLAVACNHESPTEPAAPPDGTLARAELIGWTVDAAHTAVGQVTVTLLSSDVIAATTVSRADGSFMFSDLSPGLYVVKYGVNGTAAEFGGVVHLLPGTNVHNVLVSNCRVPYGTVRDAVTGRPIAGAKVAIYFHEATTDANGHYQIDFGCDVVQGGTIVMSAEYPAYEKAETLTRASLLCTCAYDFLLTPSSSRLHASSSRLQTTSGRLHAASGPLRATSRRLHATSRRLHTTPVARSVPFEVLNRSLMLLRCGQRLERAEVPALAGGGIFLPRIQAIAAGCEFANHE